MHRGSIKALFAMKKFPKIVIQRGGHIGPHYTEVTDKEGRIIPKTRKTKRN
ncbi:MAG: hypothetical protein HOE11_02545 [Candidatus Diapherotrites archaeon]|jgi:hypothetical protein|nr:hypothetical protein [Candidatus Diapherotrites archaeon]MBT4596717.1 hypothetical protein [Candidatus Diapherotrites archaeon]